jgi:hypothetical protein
MTDTSNLPLIHVKSGTGADCYAIQLSQENATKVAEWCSGELVKSRHKNQKLNDAWPYVGVRLTGIGYDFAPIGYFILSYKHSSRWFYVYSPHAFRTMFQEV